MIYIVIHPRPGFLTLLQTFIFYFLFLFYFTNCLQPRYLTNRLLQTRYLNNIPYHMDVTPPTHYTRMYSLYLPLAPHINYNIISSFLFLFYFFI